jgi:hypothetical protein
MEGISPNSFFLPQASTNIAEQISHITCNCCPLYWLGALFRDGGILSSLHGFMAKLNESGAAHDLEDGISLQKQYRMERANRTVGQIVNASPDFHSSEDELSLGSGNALRSIEWDDGNLKIERLSTVPRTSMDDMPR